MKKLYIKSKYLSEQLTLKIHYDNSLHDKNHNEILGKKEKIDDSFEDKILRNHLTESTSHLPYVVQITAIYWLPSIS